MAEKGIYCLILNTRGAKRSVGALGEILFPPGWYIYVGSALGTGGLGRVDRHIRVYQGKGNRPPRWHIDYLLTDSRFMLTSTICGVTTDRLECTLACLLGGEGIQGFGCSDCRCTTHLLFRDNSPQQECCNALDDCGCVPVVTNIAPGQGQKFSTDITLK